MMTLAAPVRQTRPET